ncbi:MAG: Gfo/Idh/MocA family oxidoreductase [Verrucomicrobiales bacterium]|nr:Gfo/Idh/MocA family oxidoreductase [Verrucomicrobiales bacterium]
MNRRTFTKSTLATAAASQAIHLTKGHAAGYGDFADFKKRVALIGSGWYGKADLLRLIQVAPVDVVGLCDVDSKMVSEAADLVATRQVSKKTPPTYKDYKKLLAEQKPDLVLIATPDHWHALPAIDAIKAGADLYLQKPISVDIAEGQAILAAARKHKSVVQIGTQRRSTPHLIDAKNKIVDAGKLGRISHAEVCCYYHMRSRTKPEDAIAPVPDHLDWDLWTGPAPMREFNKVAHPRGWRAFEEYSNGIVGDMCVHMLDSVRWILDLGAPHTVSSAGGILMDKASIANITDTQTATFQFDDLNVTWTHRTWGNAPDPEYPWAFFIYGENGTLKASVNKYEFVPRRGESIKQDVVMELEQYPEDKTEKDLEKHVAPAIRGHMRNLLTCTVDRSKPVADVGQGYTSTAACILANMSQKLGRSLKWDEAAGKISNDTEANTHLARPYRAPYQHPAEA